MRRGRRILTAVVSAVLCGCLSFSCGNFESLVDESSLVPEIVTNVTDVTDSSTPTEEQMTETETPNEDDDPPSVTQTPIEAEQQPPENTQEPEPTTAPETPTETPSPEEQPAEQHEHVLKYNSAVDATCEEDGNVEHYHCTECGKNYSDETGENELWDITATAIGHRYGERVIAPTCTEAGYTLHECNNCGNEYTDSETPATGHSYTHTTIDPTCTEAGYTTHKCVSCNNEYTDSETPATGHSYTHTVIGPTCTEAGYTRHKCNNCGNEYTDSETTELGHRYGEWIDLNTDKHIRECARCEQTEYSEHKFNGDSCIDCEYVIVRDYEYALNEDGTSYTIVGMGNIENTELTFPATYNDLPVTAIGEGAFKNNGNITKVTIPSNIARIEPNAFLGCEKLKSIEFKNKSGWKTYDDKGRATAITLTSAANNAKYLTDSSSNPDEHYASKLLKRG